jgi:hypothetical protein
VEEDVDPLSVASALTTASQPHTAPSSIFLEAQPYSPIRDMTCLSPPRTQSNPLPAYYNAKDDEECMCQE